MQKKIIALAVAGLMSGAAFAQSNVTVFGVMDVGYNRTSGSLTDANTRNAIDAGNQSGSRVGFRGTEDLGGGLKASFQYVLNVNSGVVQSDASGTREANLALSGGFGTVLAGYVFTPQFNLLTAVDPFANGTVGALSGTSGIYAIGTQGGNTNRLQNIVAYVTPKFSGFTLLAAYSFNGTADEVARDAGNNKVWALNPTYSNGPIFAGLNIHEVKNDSTNAKNSVWDMAGSYNFGAVKLGGAYGQTKLNTAKEKQWMLGVTVPVGSGNVLASYSQNKFDTGNAKLNKWALGYTHSLSKRTNLYAAYADVDGNAAGEARIGTPTSLVNMGGVVADRYSTGLNLGVRHMF